MWVLITLLWILVAGRVVTILLLPLLKDQKLTTHYTPGNIAFQSTRAMLSAVILALAAIFLTQLSSGA